MNDFGVAGFCGKLPWVPIGTGSQLALGANWIGPGPNHPIGLGSPFLLWVPIGPPSQLLPVTKCSSLDPN